MKKRNLIPIVASLVACLAVSQTAVAEELALFAGPFGTGSYALGNAIEQISKKADAGVNVVASESPGLVFNVRKLAKEPDLKTATFTPYTTGLGYLAVNGLKPFKKKHPPAKLIANYLLGSVWLATFDPEIKSIKDLAGKRVALGRPPQILWTVEPELILSKGWGLHDEITIERLGTKPAAQALLDGKVDAAIIGGYANVSSGEFKPSPQTAELMASGRTLYHIPWGKDAVQKTMDSGVGINHLSVPTGAVAGMDAPMNGFFDAIAWVAYPELPDETVYNLTKMIIDHVGEFKEYHALGKLMAPGTLAYGWKPENIHPGALKAYREAGLVK
ncbi:TAXI family TRAP transporter solute-binding subunit [Sneathiella marina]|uniref:TAXI family TRAP transporter solute-binding subunit n=1 Tax=Sneathiella marina TaxID=2950108 RepID=A0ABY4W8L8_9PROT|nr:TAXI family TRAP transporter solute-binding subunit [Sneathiella marina]USG62483.1 TAXI family TRAP transporter solute-binding subunit [Sneathiella marina]